MPATQSYMPCFIIIFCLYYTLGNVVGSHVYFLFLHIKMTLQDVRDRVILLSLAYTQYPEECLVTLKGPHKYLWSG